VSNKKADSRRLFCICKTQITSWQRWRQTPGQPGPKQQQVPKQQPEPRQQQEQRELKQPREQQVPKQQQVPKRREQLLPSCRRRPGRERRSSMPAEWTFSLLSSKRQSNGRSPKKFLPS
jgi:hypothetical protein